MADIIQKWLVLAKLAGLCTLAHLTNTRFCGTFYQADTGISFAITTHSGGQGRLPPLNLFLAEGKDP